jgi:hypothetical protein
MPATDHRFAFFTGNESFGRFRQHTSYEIAFRIGRVDSYKKRCAGPPRLAIHPKIQSLPQICLDRCPLLRGRSSSVASPGFLVRRPSAGMHPQLALQRVERESHGLVCREDHRARGSMLPQHMPGESSLRADKLKIARAVKSRAFFYRPRLFSC